MAKAKAEFRGLRFFCPKLNKVVQVKPDLLEWAACLELGQSAEECKTD